jgi:hypothetical protein
MEYWNDGVMEKTTWNNGMVGIKTGGIKTQ